MRRSALHPLGLCGEGKCNKPRAKKRAASTMEFTPMNQATEMKQASHTRRSHIPPHITNKHEAETYLLRYLSGLMYLWGLCEWRQCRRARACRHEPRQCLSRLAPLLPEEASDGVKAIIDGHLSKRTFDEVYDDAYDEIQALGAWQMAMERATKSRRKT
jgi:hypothetical protein